MASALGMAWPLTLSQLQALQDLAKVTPTRSQRCCHCGRLLGPGHAEAPLPSRSLWHSGRHIGERLGSPSGPHLRPQGLRGGHVHQSCLPANPPRQVWPESSGGASTARGTTLRKERVPGLGRFPLQFQTHHFAPLEGAALCANGEDQRGARGQSRTRLGTFLNSSINSTIAEAAVQSGPALHSDEGQRRAGVGPGLYRLETRRQGAGPPAPQPPGEHLGVHQPVGAEGTQATRSEGGTGARRCSGLSTVQTGVVGSSTPPGASRTPR